MDISWNQKLRVEIPAFYKFGRKLRSDPAGC